MADHRADGAVVHRVIGVQIEEGRLKNRRGENDLVKGRHVVGVHRLRVHAPLGAIHRTPLTRQLPLILRQGRPLDVSKKVIGGDAERGVISPLVGIANLRRELRQLF